MIEALAERRLTMINQSNVAPIVGELLNLKIGDQVEIYRKTHKDRPGWVGPAEVKDTNIEHGKITVSWQGKSIDVGLESLRRAMIFAAIYWI